MGKQLLGLLTQKWMKKQLTLCHSSETRCLSMVSILMLEVFSRFGLGRCAVEVLGPGRGERFGEVGWVKQGGGGGDGDFFRGLC